MKSLRIKVSDAIVNSIGVLFLLFIHIPLVCFKNIKMKTISETMYKEVLPSGLNYYSPVA